MLEKPQIVPIIINNYKGAYIAEVYLLSYNQPSSALIPAVSGCAGRCMAAPQPGCLQSGSPNLHPLLNSTCRCSGGLNPGCRTPGRENSGIRRQT